LGGFTSTYSSEIDGMVFLTESSVNPTSFLSLAKTGAAGIRSTTGGFIGGGVAGSGGFTSQIDAFDFTTLASTNIAANIITARYTPTGLSA